MCRTAICTNMLYLELGMTLFLLLRSIILSLFFHPIYVLSSPFFFSLPPSRDSEPVSHSMLFSPFPTKVRALYFYREKISALSSLDDLRRTLVTHASNILRVVGAALSAVDCSFFI